MMYKQRSSADGLTLLEMLVSVAILAILATLALGSYSGYRERIDTQTAISDIKILELRITSFSTSNNGNFPPNLAAINADTYLDPWGNPYEYLNIAEAKGNGKKRKDRNLVPINSDFDLYSKGPDGRSVSPLTAKHSHDDIIRANNGRFTGVAIDY